MALSNVDAAADGGTIVAGAARNKTRLRGFVARIDATGQIDATFGAGGATVIDVPGYARSFPVSMRVMDDGRVLVVGWASKSSTGSFVAFAALLDASGVPVPTFGRGGIALPKLGTNSALSALPAAGSATFPIPVSGSSNEKGAIRSWVVQLEENGTLHRSGSAIWGGPRSIPMASYVGHRRGIQQLDIERLSDGSVVGAAELIAEGDWDTFVTRFHPATGKPDTGYSNRGIEPIDVRPGVDDDEWTQAVAVGPNDRTWVLGMHRVGTRRVAHLFRTIGTGSSSSARFSDAWIGLIGPNGRPMTCGTSARKACKVAAGTRIEVAYSIKGPRSTNRLTRPWIVHWSKAAGKKSTWKHTPAVTSNWMNKSYINGRRFYRVRRGTHQFTVRRNGTATTGPAWYGSLHVRAH